VVAAKGSFFINFDAPKIHKQIKKVLPPFGGMEHSIFLNI